MHTYRKTHHRTVILPAIMNTLKLAVICIALSLISSCCGFLEGMRLYDFTYSDKVYYFDLSIYELAEKLNEASSKYYLKRQNLNEEIEFCNSAERYSEWTNCFNEKENSFQRCGYQQSSILNKKTGKQVDNSYYTCWVELKLIDIKKIKSIDTIEIDNDFGRIFITGNQKTSQLYMPFGVQVQKEKCLSETKQKVRAITEFEKNIIEEIRK